MRLRAYLQTVAPLLNRLGQVATAYERDRKANVDLETTNEQFIQAIENAHRPAYQSIRDQWSEMTPPEAASTFHDEVLAMLDATLAGIDHITQAVRDEDGEAAMRSQESFDRSRELEKSAYSRLEGLILQAQNAARAQGAGMN